MAKTLQLLLTENVDNLGSVGDVVSVRVGYARNFLLPRGLATQPSDELIQGLATKRAEAEKQVAALRQAREGVIAKLEGLEITMERACNDQGILYGAGTQQESAKALAGVGYEVKAREVRLPQTIKRGDTFDVRVKLDSDLEAEIKLYVVADRDLDEGRDDEEVGAGAGAEAVETTDGGEAAEA